MTDGIVSSQGQAESREGERSLLLSLMDRALNKLTAVTFFGISCQSVVDLDVSLKVRTVVLPATARKASFPDTVSDFLLHIVL